MQKMKRPRRPPKAPTLRKLELSFAQVLRRVEGMEIRESMLKERLEHFGRSEAGLQNIREACVHLQSMQCAIYEKVANLYDVLKIRQAKHTLSETELADAIATPERLHKL